MLGIYGSDRTTQRSALQYYSAVRAARSCLLTMLTSSSSFALIGHRTLELYYFILLLLFYFILFYFILFYFILFYFILFYFILFYFILFYFILFYFILFYFILFYFCETSQYLALFTATIFPISTPTRTVRRSLPVPTSYCSPTRY